MNDSIDSNVTISYDYITESIRRIGNTFGDVLSPEVQAYVPKHWLQFEAPACYIHYILGVLYIFILIPGFFANSIVIYLFFK